MKIGSLCSGYGGLDTAVAAVLDGEHAWFAEIDPAAVDTLKRHHPDVPNHGSIIGADWSTVEPVDVLTMGVPCQPMSAAGRQKVEADPRWLWPHALGAIRALRPRVVVFENVRNLISLRKGEVWRGILADFRDAGYAVTWLTLGACAVGAPHHRHRVFAVATLTPNAPEAVRLPVVECDAIRPLLPTPTARDGMGGPGHAADGGLNLRTAVTLLPTPLARDAVRGNEGSAGYWAARREAGRPLGAEVALRWERFAPAVTFWESLTGTPVPAPTERGPRGGLRLTAALPEWMMGLPSGYLTDHLARPDAIRLAGNGVLPAQAEAAVRRLTA